MCALTIVCLWRSDSLPEEPAGLLELEQVLRAGQAREDLVLQHAGADQLLQQEMHEQAEAVDPEQCSA